MATLCEMCLTSTAIRYARLITEHVAVVLSMNRRLISSRRFWMELNTSGLKLHRAPLITQGLRQFRRQQNLAVARSLAIAP
jgi:hypothetical protein